MALPIHFRNNKGLPPILKVMPKPTPTNKILLTIPFWNGDRDQAMALARFLADIEPQHSELADLLFVARFDSKQDPDTIRYVSRRFNVHTHTSRRQEVGWPRGCNGIFFGGMEYVYHKMAANQIPRYKAILNLGPDCVPITRDWLGNLCDIWDSYGKKVFVAGALTHAGGRDHINGDCCMLSGDLEFLKWLVVRASNFDASAGWDWQLSAQFQKRGWANIPSVISLWNTPTFDLDRWDELRFVGIEVIHGIKDFSLLELSRKKII